MFELLNQDLLVTLVELQAILVEAEKVGRNWGSAP
jgi:hypothetical protein